MTLPSADLPLPTCLRDVVLGPTTTASENGGLACVAATPGSKLVHLRPDKADEPVDRLEVVPPDPHMPIARSIDEPAIWGGVVIEHFGHMLAEGMHRLWAASLLPELRKAPVVFQGTADGRPLPPWFFDILALCGVASERVMPVGDLTRFRELHVPRQGRTLRTADLFAGYSGLFPLAPLHSREANSGERLYISRARHIQSGSYLGESLMERVLAEAGFSVLYPETMSVKTVVTRIAAAAIVVFAEGSAIHHLELCGPVAAKVVIIGRRGGAGRHYQAVLDASCRDPVILPGTRANMFLDWEPGSVTPRRGRACSFRDIRALVAALTKQLGVALREPSETEIRDAVANDLLRYLLNPLSGISSNDAMLGRALRMVRDDDDVLALVAQLTPGGELP